MTNALELGRPDHPFDLPRVKPTLREGSQECLHGSVLCNSAQALELVVERSEELVSHRDPPANRSQAEP
jgi:hypothetical protein